MNAAGNEDKIMLKGKTVVLGVTGSIAAYKIANLASMLSKLHADIHVLMTQNATNFINPITFETLTGNKCLIDTFDRNFQFNVEHVSLAKKADVVLIAPASANVIGKLANGIADGFGNKMEVFLFPILLFIITLLTGKEKIKYFLTHSKTFLTDVQYNLMIDGVLGIILIAEIYVIYASFV